MATNEWHFTQNGQPAGAPVPAAQLKQLAAAGQLQPTDMVWQEGMTAWAPASTIKGLFPPAPKPADPPPPVEKPAPPPKVSSTTKKLKPVGSGEMNPWLVLVLSILTGGLFGLWYAYRVCSAYTKAATRKTDKAGRTLGHARHPLGVMLLSYLTAGIYFSYWTYRVMQECSVYAGGRDYESRSELSLLLLFPPYAAYVALFRLPDLVKRTQAVAGVPESGALAHTMLFLNPCLFFFALPFLAMIYQDALNQVWFTAP